MMFADTSLFVDLARPILALLGGAYLVVPLVEWRRQIALRDSVLLRRVVTWTLITAVVLIALLAGLPAITLLFALIARLAAGEYVRLTHPARPYAILLRESAMPSIVVIALWPGAVTVLPFAFLLALTTYPLVTGRIDAALESVAKSLLGYVWIVWALAHGPLMARMAHGVEWLAVFAFAVALSDVGAGTLGMLFGRRKLAPAISPGKTWAGAAGNFAGAGLAFALLSSLLPSSEPAWLVALVVLVAVGSLWGDLIESLVKRAAGAKDAGTLLPGFGGLLDRIDSLLVVLPLAYYALNILTNF
jgi:phosphatidate cytidylyltransferase